MEGHPFAKRLSEDEFSMVKELTLKNVKPQNILLALKEQNENNVSTINTIYYARQKLRMIGKLGKTPMQVLMTLLHLNNFVYEFSTNDSNELNNLFFVHPTSFEIWRAFPHVLIIDATYKTNKYNMPFVQIVGVTSTSKTFCIAFAFMDKEKEANYSWVLNCLKLTLEECMQPRVIVTDRELALVNACGRVFPNATRLLCRWHITENIKKNCSRTFKSQPEWDSFRAMWKLLQNSPTWTAYSENYTKLQSMLIKYPKVLKYLDEAWLNKYKEMFVSVWIDQHLNFGNRTTNRVESQHAKLKSHLDSANSTLDKFVGCIDKIVKLQVTAIKESFEISRIYLYHEHNLPCFQQLRGLVSIDALNLMLKELKRTNEIQLNSSNCGCQLRTSCGLPCACVLLEYLNSGQCIPLDSIDIFWRKLDISPLKYEQTDDIRCDDVVEMFTEKFHKQSNVGKRSWLRKLKEIFNRSTTDVKEPAVIKNTRGRPSLKKKQQQKRADPKNQDARRHSSYGIDLNQEPTWDDYDDIDLNREPTRHSSYEMNLNEEPMRHSSYVNFQGYYSDPLMSEIPDIFYPYITHIDDVMGDGNCGFRAFAVCLGYNQNAWLNIREQLLDELHTNYQAYACVFSTGINEIAESLYYRYSPAPKKYWMSMPATGVLMANRFGMIVHCLSKKGCNTIFPLWRGPEEFPHHQSLTVAHVRGDHFVMVQLQGEYPMPHITAYWNLFKTQSAVGWETMYKSRLDLYAQFNPPSSERVFINCVD